MTTAHREAEATTRDARAADEHDARQPDATEPLGPRAFAPLVLQVPLEPRADGRYRIDELLAFHDLAFVESAYAAALGRGPTAEESSSALADLRSLRREKMEIVEDLTRSAEGRRAGARVTGVAPPGWKRRLRRLPVVGYLWRLIASVVRLPVSLRHAREAEAYALAQQQLIADHFNAQMQSLSDHVSARDRSTEEIFRGFQRQIEFVAGRADETRGLAEESRALVNDAIAAVSVLSDALAALADRQSSFDRRLDSQHEFLAREQQAIVEAQKAALAEIEGRLTHLLSSHIGMPSKLSGRADDDSSRGGDGPALAGEPRARDGDAGAA